MTTESPTPTDHEALGRALVDAAWNAGGFERVKDLCAPEVVVHDPAKPTAGTGSDGYEQYVSRIMDGVSDLKLTIEDVTVADGTVAIRVAGSGTPTDHFLGRDSNDEDGETTFSGLEVIDI